MSKSKKSEVVDFDVEIGVGQRAVWSPQKLDGLKKFIKGEADKKTSKQRLHAELLSIQYRMEDYIEKNDLTEAEIQTLETFIKAFLGTLNITFKKFATSIDTTDSNLKKYISGERKLSTELALKFGYFFHTSADIWLRVQMKNELHALQQEKVKVNRYKKYDYEKLLS